MTKPPQPVGYRQPPGPRGRLKSAFDSAFNAALSADKKPLLESRPIRVIDAFARELVLGALDGRASAQRLVLGILDKGGGGGVEEAAGAAQEPETAAAAASGLALRGAPDMQVPGGNSGGTAGGAGDDIADNRRPARNEGEEEDDDDEESGEENRFVYDDEHTRQLFGDRYGEFKARFERAVNANDLDALDDLAADFGCAGPRDRKKSAEV
ncbi:MAG TPA: hypothetical protein VKR31_09615 [Rhizomicrobium sp.]|nr:hypothetical protein [Rhizomicrobium sp.]